MAEVRGGLEGFEDDVVMAAPYFHTAARSSAA
jgi:hypothetical protein